MKKVIVFALVLCMIPLCCYAEGNLMFKYVTGKLPQLDEDQLEEVYRIVYDMIFAYRSAADGIMLEPGMYEVGVDIPAGNYYFECVAGRFPVSIHVYPSIEKTHVIDQIQSVSNVGYGYSCQSTKTGKFILKDGWIVELVQGPAVIHVFTGLF